MSEIFVEFLNFFAWCMVFYFGFKVFLSILYSIWLSHLADELAKHAQQLKANKDKSPEVVRTRVEFENGIYYLYNIETSEFVVQGTNISDMIKNLQNKLKNSEIKIVEGDKDILLKLKEKQ